MEKAWLFATFQCQTSMKFFLALALVVACQLRVVGQTQTPAAGPQTAAEKSGATVLVHATPELNEIRLLFRQGLYHQIVEKATVALDKAGPDAPEFLYWRGYARRRLSLFDEALTDLEPLGNVTGWATLPSASQLTQELKEIVALRPVQEMDVRDGNTVVFRVYYEEDDQFLRNVMDALPKGYKAASTLVDEDAPGIPVFVFGENYYEEFVGFYTATKKSAPRSWWRVLSNEGAIFISQRNAREESFAADYPHTAVLLSHEMTHLLMADVLGTSRDLPNWFSEGAARFGEAIYLPSLTAQNDRTMQQLLQQNALLPLSQLVSSNSLQDAVDQQKNGGQQTDAYAQSFNMTRYLGVLLKGKKLKPFLETMRDKGGFAPALKEGTGLTPEEFYQSWLGAVKGQNN